MQFGQRTIAWTISRIKDSGFQRHIFRKKSSPSHCNMSNVHLYRSARRFLIQFFSLSLFRFLYNLQTVCIHAEYRDDGVQQHILLFSVSSFTSVNKCRLSDIVVCHGDAFIACEKSDIVAYIHVQGG